MWNPSICGCECNKAWKVDKYLDIKICSCKKHTFVELVLAWEDEILNTTETSLDDKIVTGEKNDICYMFNIIMHILHVPRVSYMFHVFHTCSTCFIHVPRVSYMFHVFHTCSTCFIHVPLVSYMFHVFLSNQDFLIKLSLQLCSYTKDKFYNSFNRRNGNIIKTKSFLH